MCYTTHKVSYLMILSIILIGLIGCESNFKEIQKDNFTAFVPSGEAEDFNLKYTDSGKIKSILISPRMLSYSNADFPFTEFPEGIDVTLYDNKAKKTFVKSDYAISYKDPDVIDLRGNVRISTENGQLMETSQLYFDQKNEWFYTQKKFKFTDAKGVSNGEGIDFSKDFKIVNSQKINGLIDQAE